MASLFVNGAWGWDRGSGGSRVALGAVRGGAEPGALVGNLRAPLCAALDPDAPILAPGFVLKRLVEEAINWRP